jgi:hypothetical protein
MRKICLWFPPMAIISAVALAVIAPAGAVPGDDLPEHKINLTTEITGAGAVERVPPGPEYICDQSGNLDDGVAQTCPVEEVGLGQDQTHVWLSATPQSAPSGHWKFVGWTGCDKVEDDGTCRLDWDVSGQTNDKSVQAVFNDTLPPDVQITGLQFGHLEATVSFTTNEGPTECQLDGTAPGSWAECVGSVTYRNLSEGEHTVFVMGTDPSGESAIASTTFQIVDTKLTEGPEADVLLNSRSAEFGFTSVAGTTFECGWKLSASPAEVQYSSCDSPFEVTVQGDGQWTFFVRATRRTSRGAFVDPVPATRTWRVDTQPPTVTFNPLVGPPQDAVVTAASSVFEFTADEPVTGFECKLDDGDYGRCESAYKALSVSNGRHSLAVRATDQAGNTGAPTTRSWTVAQDDDGDTYPAGPDCDDAHAGINPGARDMPDNLIDENCDGRDAVNLDRDGDGYDRDEPGARVPFDCDDGKAGIHPGATDKPRNAVDENCDGRDADYPSITSEVRYVVKSRQGLARFTRLLVRQPPSGATVELRCKGKRKGCKFSRRRQTAAPGTRKLGLTRYVRKAKLRRGAVLEVWITRSGMRGKVVRLGVGRGGRVRGVTLCVLPGSRTPTGCPPA